MMFVLAFDLIAETGREILFVPDHHIDVLGQITVHFLCLGLPADGLPERVAIIKVVRDYGAMFFGDLHRLPRDVGCRFRQRAKDAAGMKPSRTFLTKNLFPIDVAPLELRDGRVTAVRTSECSTDAETAFGK